MATIGKRGKEPEPTITGQQVEEFERIAGQLSALHQEFGVQAKSKPDNPINKFKLKMLNEKLGAANGLLTGPYKPFADCVLFDDADLPTNSDVALVLSTYLASLERWRSAHVYRESGNWYWRTGEGSRIEAARATIFTPVER
ncbi:MAG TPA: hypothetical protein VF856_01055 [Gemmatimonadaceae bacterium]